MPPLVRYFSKQYANAFVQRGEVLFRSLSYFRDYEDQGVRADMHEGTLVHRPTDGLRITKVETGESIELPHKLESSAREDEILIYCLSTELSESVAQRFQAEVAVEIVNPAKFLARLRSALGLRPRIRAEKLIHQPVRYYEWHEPPIVDWALPERIAMRKPKSFEWQSEYRLAVPVGNAFAVENVSLRLVPLDAPPRPRATSHPSVLLKLGSLAKICRIHHL